MAIISTYIKKNKLSFQILHTKERYAVLRSHNRLSGKQQLSAVS